MTKKYDLTPEEVAKLPGRTHFSVREVAWMAGVEYETALAEVTAGRIPSQPFGRIHRVPAWWVNQQLTGVDEAPESSQASDSGVARLAARRTA